MSPGAPPRRRASTYPPRSPSWARRARAAAGRAQDGLEESSTLLERLLVALGLQDFDDLIRWTATATPAQVAALAPHVLHAARDGETVAQRAVNEAAGELAQLVGALM